MKLVTNPVPGIKKDKEQQHDAAIYKCHFEPQSIKRVLINDLLCKVENEIKKAKQYRQKEEL